jgi:hypothetical protein
LRRATDGISNCHTADQSIFPLLNLCNSCSITISLIPTHLGGLPIVDYMKRTVLTPTAGFSHSAGPHFTIIPHWIPFYFEVHLKCNKSISLQRLGMNFLSSLGYKKINKLFCKENVYGGLWRQSLVRKPFVWLGKPMKSWRWPCYTVCCFMSMIVTSWPLAVTSSYNKNCYLAFKG